MHAPLCVIFAPNSGYIAHYVPFIWHKSPTNCDAHLAESIFQTRSRSAVHHSALQIPVTVYLPETETADRCMLLPFWSKYMSRLNYYQKKEDAKPLEQTEEGVPTKSI